ncbi:hypothetical protein Vadar_009339 [Vaccinium darrowii]|uniref:Uncharacterized protein n=1 Tax=Vaccinium darrowii TaxID=229202 RepID=A0ACB7WZA2_9ERIC|nr:hypothetical protein Vadar_009339 [Vaccinium darrowii]
MEKNSTLPTSILILLLLNFGTLLSTLACSSCPNQPTPPELPPKVRPPPSPPKPPIVKPPPPYVPKPPVVKPPYIPKPPIVKPPTPPTFVPKPPPQVEKPCPPPPPALAPKGGQTCPIDTLKLGACVDLLGGLIHVGLGSSAKDTCCPVIAGLVDLDAAICLCTTIKAKLLNINVIVPIALQVLIDCGKTPPEGFQCA